MHYLYILRSRKDSQLYTGYTNDLRARIAKHKAGKVISTKSRLPVDLLYYESYVNEEDARERERYFKTGWGRAYVRKILSNTLKK